MAASSHQDDQLPREVDLLSSSEEDGAPRETRAFMLVRATAMALALCGAAAIAAVFVLQAPAMGNMRVSPQNDIGLAKASPYECPICKMGDRFPNSIYICGDKEVTAAGCSTSGCQSKTDQSNYCIAPVNAKLVNDPPLQPPFDYMYKCNTIQNNPYECPATNGGCSLKTCEVGKSYAKISSHCSQKENLTDAKCGTDGCVFKTTPETQCYAPEYTNLIDTKTNPGSYKYVCQYTGKKPSHAYMCPQPPTAGQCVLGTSVVNTLTQDKLVRDARIGDTILVNHAIYEPIIDFLHALPKHEGARLIHVEHDMGRLSASAEHVVFVIDRPSKRSVSKAMKDVRVGDFLIDSEGQHRAITDVVEGISGSEGLFAPLTPSGTMIVDGMLMSNYASIGGRRIPHGAMHAAFFCLRVWRSMSPASNLTNNDELNFMAKFLWRVAGPLVLPASL